MEFGEGFFPDFLCSGFAGILQYFNAHISLPALSTLFSAGTSTGPKRHAVLLTTKNVFAIKYNVQNLTMPSEK